MPYMLLAETTDFSSALTTAFDTIKGDVLGYVGVAIPVALAIVGAIFGVKAAVRFFKGLAK